VEKLYIGREIDMELRGAIDYSLQRSHNLRITDQANYRAAGAAQTASLAANGAAPTAPRGQAIPGATGMRDGMALKTQTDDLERHDADGHCGHLMDCPNGSRMVIPQTDIIPELAARCSREILQLRTGREPEALFQLFKFQTNGADGARVVIHHARTSPLAFSR
jgi:hypothetical protein